VELTEEIRAQAFAVVLSVTQRTRRGGLSGAAPPLRTEAGCGGGHPLGILTASPSHGPIYRAACGTVQTATVNGRVP
jgi:hypothetical protein